MLVIHITDVVHVDQRGVFSLLLVSCSWGLMRVKVCLQPRVGECRCRAWVHVCVYMCRCR